jgi:hypothetical protein
MMVALGQNSWMPAATCLEMRRLAVGARLARHAGGADDQLGALEDRVVLGRLELDVAADHREPLGDVERLALGDRLLVGDRLLLFRIVLVDERGRIHEPDVASESATSTLLDQHTADETAANDSDLVEHSGLLSLLVDCARCRRALRDADCQILAASSVLESTGGHFDWRRTRPEPGVSRFRRDP